MRVVLLFLATVATTSSSNDFNDPEAFFEMNSTDFGSSNNDNQLNALQKVGEKYVFGIGKAVNSKISEGMYYLERYPRKRAQNIIEPMFYYEFHDDPMSGNSYISMLVEPPSLKVMAMKEPKIPIILLLHGSSPIGYDDFSRLAENWAKHMANEGFYVFVPDLIGVERVEYGPFNEYWQAPNETEATIDHLLSDRLGELQHRIKLGFNKLASSVSVFAPKSPDFEKVLAIGLNEGLVTTSFNDLGGLAALDMARTKLLGVKGVLYVFGTDFSTPGPGAEHVKSDVKVLAMLGRRPQADKEKLAKIREFEKEMTDKGMDWQIRVLGLLGTSENHLVRDRQFPELATQFCHQVFEK